MVSRRNGIFHGAVTSFELIVLILAVATPVAAQNVKSYTRSTFDEWLAKAQPANPDFKPGEVLTAKDLDRMRPYLPPGYVEQLNFPEFKAEIIAPRSHTPRKDYQDCTEKYQAQVILKPDGTVGNHPCGQPFSDDSITTADPKSGIKAAWNFEYRWQNFGQFALNYVYIFVRFGGSHEGQAPKVIELPPNAWTTGVTTVGHMPEHPEKFFGGGGTFDKIISSFYQRVYLSELAPMAEHGGLMNVPDAKEYLWKEFAGFFSPYDMRGQVFITFRYSDPNRADDAWAYDPKLRRVRRISVEVKSDSLVGTDQTQEDFYSFSGRAVQWNWKFLGWRNILCVMDSKHDYGHFFGPNGEIPDDVWSVRKFAVMERTPKVSNHPYSSVVMFWDAENWHPWMSIAFTRDKKLWKIWDFQNRWTEDVKDFAEINHGVQATILQAESVIDVQNDRATLFSGFGNGYPTPTVEHVSRLFDINKLEEVHR
ncbi:MAG: outer rane lipoproteinsorting protein [Candidatus Binatus sp.]|nr:outer rane lipoproteinsorting protein [Candidatus Binatus sp.]